MKKKKFVIIGSGLFGSVLAERIANDLGSNVYVFEKRNHVGGNCYSKVGEETNIDIHMYGPHIFHTSIPRVWEYINCFTAFNNYRHKVLVNYKGKLYPFPINLLTISMVYNNCTQPCQVNACLKKDRISTSNPASFKNFKDTALKAVGKRLYTMFYKGYTKKQWGMDPKHLPASIFQRIPIRYDHNNDYFNDKWQGIPIDGYAAMFDKMLRHKRIKVTLDRRVRLCALAKDPDTIIIYTGKLDSAFNYKYGELEWRSLRFDTYINKANDYQGIAVINYTEEGVPYTRVVEHKHFHSERKCKGTVLTYEYPVKNNREPYYPINTPTNYIRYTKYIREAKKMKNFYYGGRLADYKYYNMDQTIDAALTLYDRIKKEV